MAFPSSPSNGQSAIVNGITYVYSTATNSWGRNSSANVAVLNVTGNVSAGNIVATGFYFGNGTPFVSSSGTSYTNANVAAYLPTDPTITGIQANVGGFYNYANVTYNTVANAGILQNQITGANSVIATTNANIGSFYTYANATYATKANTGSLQDQITGANSAIITANTALKSYVDTQYTAITTAWTSNAATQDASIKTINANIGGFYTYANATYSTIANASSLQDQITGANLVASGTNANIGGFYTYANATYSTIATTTSLQNQITGANAAIVTANTALKSYVDTQNTAITTAWTSNAASQQGQITTLQNQVYANANAVAYFMSSGLQSTPVGSVTTSSGAFTTLTASDITQFTNSTASTNTATGAVVVTGGAAIGGNLWVGGNIYAVNVFGVNQDVITVQDPLLYLQALGNLTTYNYDIGFYSDYTAPGYRHTGLARSVASNTWVFFSNVASEPDVAGINWSDAGIAYDTVKAGTLILANTTSAISTTTGALQVAGGIGVAGAIYGGGGMTVGGNDISFVNVGTNINLGINQVSGILSLGGTAQTGTITVGQSTVTQAITVASGITTSGNTKTVYFGANGASGSQTTIIVGPATGAGNLYVAQGTSLLISNIAQSTSNVTGALQVAGGVGISGNINASGNIYAVGTGSRHGYTWANSVSSAYQVFNSATNSIDTVFG